MVLAFWEPRKTGWNMEKCDSKLEVRCGQELQRSHSEPGCLY